jgi:hypothetical protein
VCRLLAQWGDHFHPATAYRNGTVAQTFSGTVFIDPINDAKDMGMSVNNHKLFLSQEDGKRACRIDTFDSALWRNSGPVC